MIRVGLVEDQQLVRQGIASLLTLSDEIVVSWQAENGQEALEKLTKNQVDILLSDIRMPVLDGISMVKRIRSSDSSKVPVLMLTTFDDSELFLASLQAGANGFLLKDVSLDKLLSAITVVAQGGHLIEPSVLAQMHETTSALTITPAVDVLSERECHILKLIAGGFSNKEIASAVFLAEGTVKNHVSNILTKLDCRDRTQAVLKGMQRQLI